MVSRPYSSDFTLDGKVAVITGAGSGIGAAAAKLFSEKGAAVCLIDRNIEAVKKVADTIGHACVWQADVSKYESVEKVVNDIILEKGAIDILVHSAGVGDIEWAKDFDEQTWRKVIDMMLGSKAPVSKLSTLLSDLSQLP